MSPKQAKIKIAISFGPPVTSGTSSGYGYTEVIVTDCTGKPQPPVRVTPAEASFVATIQEGDGSVQVIDYDTEGRMLSTVSQSFTPQGTVGSYQPATMVTVAPETAATPTPAKASVWSGTVHPVP